MKTIFTRFDKGIFRHYTIVYYIIFKGYISYKTITSENVSSEAQVNNFLFRREVMYRCQDIQVLIFSTIPWFTKSVTAWWILVHETECIFEYIFWTTTHLVTKLGQMIDINKGNSFKEAFEQFEDWG